MATRVTCPACGGTTELPVAADEPARCPGCGAPLPVGRPRRRRWPLVVVGVVLAGGLAAAAWGLTRSGGPEWKAYAYSEGGFRVDLPAHPENVAKATGIRPRPGVRLRGTARPGEREEYAVLFYDLDPYARASKTDDALVAEAAAALLSETPPAKRLSESDASVGEFASREVAFEVPDRGVSGAARVVVVAERVFVVAAVGPGITPDDDRARRFLDSFEVTDPDLLARGKEKRDQSRRVATAGQPVAVEPVAKLESVGYSAFDPARGAFWTVAHGRPGEAPRIVTEGGVQKDARSHYARRYSYPGFRLEAEYRLAERPGVIAVGGDRLYVVEYRQPPKAAVAAVDLRQLPPADDRNPPDLPVAARAELPGDGGGHDLAADPAGRWLYAVGSDYQRLHVCRLPADLSGPPVTFSRHVNLNSGPVVSGNGATVTVAYDDLYTTTWVDLDPQTWEVRRKRGGDRARYALRLWAPLADRIVAAGWDGDYVNELEWGTRLIPEVTPVLTRQEVGAGRPLADLRPSPDGRYLFCVFGLPSPVLKVIRADVRLPEGMARPVAAAIPLTGEVAFGSRVYVAPDGGAVVLSNGQAFSVRYPPAR